MFYISKKSKIFLEVGGDFPYYLISQNFKNKRRFLMFKKRFISLIILALLISTGIMPGYSSANSEDLNSISLQSNLELSIIENLEDHQDVKDYIIENGYEQYLSNENQIFSEDLNYDSEFNTNYLNDLLTNQSDSSEFQSTQIEEIDFEKQSELVEQYDLETPSSEITSFDLIDEIDLEKRNQLIEKYDLETPSSEITSFDQDILVKRDLTTNAIANVWYLNYLPSNAGFTVAVVNVGKTPLDSVSGTLKKYNKKKEAWVLANSKLFTQKSVNSGIVYTWPNSKTAVSDYFEYNITVKEGSTSLTYNNTGETNHQRYNFASGAYNKLEALGGERHHIVSANSLKENGFKATTAPAIRMIYKDHVNTPNWGNYTTSTIFRGRESLYLKAKEYKQLLQLEVDSLKTSLDSEGKFSNLQVKYFDEVVNSLYLAEKYFGI
jgi:hypothetical protein